jgi:hypothetical protein
MVVNISLGLLLNVLLNLTIATNATAATDSNGVSLNFLGKIEPNQNV